MSEQEVPRYAVLSPYVAQWLMQQMAAGATVTKALARSHALWLREIGQVHLAREVVVAWSQVEASAGQWRERAAVQPRPPASGASVDGSAEAEIGEVGAGSGVLADVTTKEAAEMLGVSERRVGQMLAAGALTGRKVGRSWLVDRGSVETLRDARSA